MIDYRDYITIEMGKRGGKPCIRSMRITVYDVLNLRVPAIGDKPCRSSR